MTFGTGTFGVGTFGVGTIDTPEVVDIVTLDEVKASLSLTQDARYDSELSDAIAATTAHLRLLGVVAGGSISYVLRARGGTLILPTMHASSVSLLDDYGTTVTGSWVNLGAGVVEGLRDGIYTAVVTTPAHADVKKAALWIVQHMWEQQRGAVPVPYAGGSDETFSGGRSFAIPQRAMDLLEPHVGVQGIA